MSSENLGALLGLARKAGKAVAGNYAVQRAIKQQKVFLLLIAADAAPNTKDEFRKLASHYNIPVCEFLTKVKLGASIGSSESAVVAVLDPSFAQAIRQKSAKPT